MSTLENKHQRAIAHLQSRKVDEDDVYTTKAFSEISCLQGVDLSDEETMMGLMPTLVSGIGGHQSSDNIPWELVVENRLEPLKEIYEVDDVKEIVKAFCFSDGIRTWGGGYSKGCLVYILGKEYVFIHSYFYYTD